MAADAMTWITAAGSVLTTVTLPLVWYLLSRRDSEFAEAKRLNSESHAVLHRKVEECQSKLHALEVQAATQAGQLRELDAVSRSSVSLAEFERAFGQLREDIREIKRAVLRSD